MNKSDVIKKIAEKTGLPEEKCVLINDVLDDNFIIGRNNKDKIVKGIIEKLNVPQEQADDIYNKCMEVIVKGIFKK